MITLYNGDFLNFDSQIINESCDLLLTDPPYNISQGKTTPIWIDKETGLNKNTIHNQNFSENFDDKWDECNHEDFLKLLNEWSLFWFKKIRKGGAFAIFISDKYISFLWKIMENNGFEPKRIFTWKKPAAIPFNKDINPVSGCEYILWGIKPGGKRTFNSSAYSGSIIERFCLADKISSIVYRIIRESPDLDLEECFKKAKKESLKLLENRKIKNNLVECIVPNTITYSGGSSKNRIHPTQKPEEILKFFISLLTKENDTILDTFAGSGSTGHAAIKLNRKIILIEKDYKMFNNMKNSFENYISLNLL